MHMEVTWRCTRRERFAKRRMWKFGDAIGGQGVISSLFLTINGAYAGDCGSRLARRWIGL